MARGDRDRQRAEEAGRERDGESEWASKRKGRWHGFSPGVMV